MKTMWGMAAVLSVITAPGAFGAETNLCPPRTQWDRSYGGAGVEVLAAMVATPDGGFVAGGRSDSSNGDRQSPAHGSSDVWVVRLNSAGDLLWERSFGGSAYDSASSIAPTGDGGFIVGASSGSVDGNKTSPGFGNGDYWLIRLDGDGNKVWEKSFGGLGSDALGKVLPTADGGFFLAGASDSRPGGTKTSTNFSGSQSGYDFWVIRTDSSGNELWERSYGGTDSDYFGSVVATADGGFLLGGTSYSGQDGVKTTRQFGYGDYWVVRIDANGEIVWQGSFGGQNTDSLGSIARASGDGFLIGGVSYSSDGLDKISPYFGGGDYWVVRLNAQGDTLWEASFGGESYDRLASIQELAGGGFVLGGDSVSLPSGNKTSVSWGGSDYWVVRLDASGQKVWEQSYGALGEESLGRSVLQTSDGGFAFGGSSPSRARGGKTAPLLGETDFWIVRTAGETPADCDGDGVLDGADQCPDTPFGGPVNASGCSIAQYCPCDGPWTSLSNYVACVESNTIPFVAGGIISEEQRQALIADALDADCPPTPQSVVVFGLTNSVLGDAVITSGSSVYSQLQVADTGPNGTDGVSIHLGEADSGVFVYPYADMWGNFSDAWFMLGTAYGRVNGQSHALVSTMRATKPYYETYPVDVDLSPLGPQNVSFLVWSNDVLVAEATHSGPVGGVTVRSSTTLGPRANPFWRMPDGSVGALIEFTETGGESIPATIEGPFGEVAGNRVFIRANSPSNIADYVSRLDVVLGGGLTTFSVTDERPGVFGRPHRVLGSALIEPALGRLQLTRMAPAYPGESYGVMVELRGDRQLNVGLEPVALSNASARLSFSLDAAVELQFAGATNAIAVGAFFYGLDGYHPLEVLVYRQGILQGALAATNHQPIGWIAVADTNDWPRIIGCGGSSETNADLAVSFSLDRIAAFTGVGGSQLYGDHFRIAATNANHYFTVHSTGVLTAIELPMFAITSEDSIAQPPPVAIARHGAEYIISWPARNLPLVLESSPALEQTFTPVEAGVTFQAGRHRASLPAAEQGNRFFRLRLAAE